MQQLDPSRAPVAAVQVHPLQLLQCPHLPAAVVAWAAEPTGEGVQALDHTQIPSKVEVRHRCAGAAQAKPPWLRQRAPQGERFEYLQSSLRDLKLNTVCEEAMCPNVGECWNGGDGTATIMLLGGALAWWCFCMSVHAG